LDTFGHYAEGDYFEKCKKHWLLKRWTGFFEKKGWLGGSGRCLGKQRSGGVCVANVRGNGRRDARQQGGRDTQARLQCFRD
jgi:hypothetical protein